MDKQIFLFQIPQYLVCGNCNEGKGAVNLYEGSNIYFFTAVFTMMTNAMLQGTFCSLVELYGNIT